MNKQQLKEAVGKYIEDNYNEGEELNLDDVASDVQSFIEDLDENDEDSEGNDLEGDKLEDPAVE